MLLAVDVGNTRIKAAVFEENTLVALVAFDLKMVEKEIDLLLKKYSEIHTIVVASVGKLDAAVWISFENRANVFLITPQTKFPFENRYATPNSLGIDRMVLAAGAVLQFPGQNRLVIDAGTCITYDFINEKDEYLGGAISPGIRLRYEALHQFTAKLPLLTRQVPENFIGQSTSESIHSGVIGGVLHEIEGFVAEYQAQYAKFIIILTGGDADFLANRLKNTIFAHSNFLLESLNQTFQYNQK